VTRHRFDALGYGAAAAAVAVATLARLVFDRFLPDHPFLTYIFAVLFAAVFCGVGPGVATVIGSIVAADYFFMEPIGALVLAHADDAIRCALFALLGLGVVFAAGVRRGGLARRDAAREAAESEARLLAERLNVALCASPVILFEQDRDLRFVWIANPAHRFHPDEVTGRSDADVLQNTPEAEALIARKRQVLETKTPWRGELAVTVDGHRRCFDLSIQPRLSGGEVVGVLGAAVDLTERVRMEDELRASAARERQRAAELQALLDTAPIGLAIATDASGAHIRGNPANEAMFGVSPQGEFSKKSTDVFIVSANGRELPVADLPMQRALRGETVAGQVMDVSRPGGETLTVFGRAAPLYDEDGAPRGAVGAFLDITPLRRAEQALEQADRRKDAFIATMAHELRNPLSAICNGVFTLRRAPGAVEADRLHEMMERQTGALVRLVDDLLDTSRFSSGKIALRRQRTTILPLLDQAIEAVAPAVAARRLRLLRPPAPQDQALFADPARVTQIFTNLLSNAVKFTPEGGTIEIEVACDDTAVSVSVRDTGVGIAPETLPTVFDWFVQGGKGSSEGLGVGLALARELTRLHGGTIEAHSDGAGRGAVFTVRLPIDPAQP